MGSVGSTRYRARPRRRDARRGQAVVEFAVVMPVFLLIVLGVVDLGRAYNAVVQTEAAAREAADFGSFRWYYWNADNAEATQAEIVRRACTASLGLADYEGAADGSTCTNPTVSFEVAGGGQCALPLVANPEPACTVHVRVELTFRTILRLPFVPNAMTIQRDSWFTTGWQDT